MALSGRFVWRELITPEPERAAVFLHTVFGWEARALPMGDQPYTMLRHPGLGEDTGGAMRPIMDGVPPHWLNYLTVDDVDAALVRVAELGGAVITGAMDLPGIGRFAVVADPSGAVIAVFRGANPGATDTERTPPDGTFCWSQLMTTDVAGCAAFYGALVGWTTAPMGPTGVVFLDGAVARGSAMANPMPEAPSHWLSYVAVPDVDARFAAATAAGATTFVPPTDMPGMGRFAVLADPTGAAFALWKNAPPASA